MKFIVLLLFFPLVGCSDLTLDLPASRFETPEANGQLWKANFGASIAQQHEVTLVQDASSRPPLIGPTQFQRDTGLDLFASLGLSKMIEAKIRTKLSSEQFLLKFQLFGASAMEAKANNFSLALTAGIGGGSISRSGTQDTLFGPADANWRGRASYVSDDFALILGYRVNEDLLFYGGPYITEYHSKTSIDQDATSDGNNPAANYSFNEYGHGTGGNLAVQIHIANCFSVSIEEVFSHLTWATGVSTDAFTTGAQVSCLY